jgi:hypothetical protein
MQSEIMQREDKNKKRKCREGTNLIVIFARESALG